MFWPLIRLLPKETHFKFVSFAPIAAGLSGLAVLASIVSFFLVGLNFGTDFKGGTLIEVLTPGPAPLSQLRSSLDGMGVKDAQVQGIRNARRVEHQCTPAERLQRGEGHVDREPLHPLVEGFFGVEGDGQVGRRHGIRADRAAPCRAESLALRLVEGIPRLDQDVQAEHVDDEVRRHDARCVLLRSGAPSSSRAAGSLRTGSLLGVLASS